MNTKTKKGFTLIELIAVIVILAIVALISVPVITGIIKDTKKQAFKTS
ncbi:MAG: type II secretion system protein, partial [Bacilli bacterium]|nr:type II secretion system protein [Bacilli bacterium]